MDCFPGLGLGEYTSNNEKQSLLKFDLDVAPSGGCTLTPGYWKTHSEHGPAPYDDTWAQLPNGANTPFFLSGKTYFQVLWTPPAGNAYYNLSFHYIAAKLNFLNGADPSAAQAAFNSATTLFNTYTPAQIKALKGNNQLRQQFISLAGILGNYNEGIIGPGHCD
jgi:peptidoglycan hydrolase-like protein with peptidoglycan-binding domain